jgi:hypothetical protein
VRWPWKLVVSEGEASRLYDLARDPGEQQDVAPHEPEQEAWLLRELRHATAEATGRRSARVPAVLDAEIRQQLEALGYVD